MKKYYVFMFLTMAVMAVTSVFRDPWNQTFVIGLLMCFWFAIGYFNAAKNESLAWECEELRRKLKLEKKSAKNKAKILRIVEEGCRKPKDKPQPNIINIEDFVKEF